MYLYIFRIWASNSNVHKCPWIFLKRNFKIIQSLGNTLYQLLGKWRKSILCLIMLEILMILLFWNLQLRDNVDWWTIGGRSYRTLQMWAGPWSLEEPGTWWTEGWAEQIYHYLIELKIELSAGLQHWLEEMGLTESEIITGFSFAQKFSKSTFDLICLYKMMMQILPTNKYLHQYTVSTTFKVVHIGPKYVHIWHILVQTTPKMG